MNIEALLPAYVAGELDEDDWERVDIAIAASPQLQAEVERYRQLFLLFTTTVAEEIVVPPDLEDRIGQRIGRPTVLGNVGQYAGGLFGAYGRALVYYLGLE